MKTLAPWKLAARELANLLFHTGMALGYLYVLMLFARELLL